MNEWWKHPQKIKFWKKNIDYVMFVDENGSEGKLKYIMITHCHGDHIGGVEELRNRLRRKSASSQN